MKLLTLALLSLSVGVAPLLRAAENDKMLGPSTTIVFDRDTATLSADSKTKLHELIAEAEKKGGIHEVQVAVWSDKALPQTDTELSRQDRSLAHKRAIAIKDYLKKPLKVGDIDIYNMSEKASWLARSFNSSDAQLKEEMARGGKKVMSNEEFQTFKVNGEPSKAVIQVISKKNRS
ncbi:MAG: hypothetical protein KA116_11345 [Proteobacteria bacterium]|nr:hypothetical protein [Pseudomonadota bacterium]